MLGSQLCLEMSSELCSLANHCTVYVNVFYHNRLLKPRNITIHTRVPRQRSGCKDCGGASICQHYRIRSTCKDCGGTSICEHNRRRSQCKDYGARASESISAKGASVR
jgi:hypothetical protein